MVLDLLIVGAGPYGISLASHAKETGINYQIVGYPMEFWQKQMPPEMFIRTQLEYTGLSDPGGHFTLNQYGKEKSIELKYPLPRPTFVDYGLWFIQRTGIHITEDYVSSVARDGELFEITTEKGETIYSRFVVIAVGLTNAKYIPENINHLPENLVTHSSQHTEFGAFQGKRVLVLGGGQSAWEAAALLNKENADVELAYRRGERISPRSGTNKKQRYYEDKFYFMDENKKEDVRNELRVPTVSDFLVPLVEGKVHQRPYTFVREAFQTREGHLKVTFQQGEQIVVDHLIAATGFRYAIDNLRFLNPVNPKIIKEVDGQPKLNEYFQSAVPGLYFVGPSSANNHGPTFQFVSGVGHTATKVTAHIKKDFKGLSETEDYS